MEKSILQLIVGSVILFVFVGTLVALVSTGWYNPTVLQFVMDHFRVIVGLPSAGLFAFLIVAIFQVGAGQIEFDILTVKFRGAARPIVMWVLSFLAIALGIGTLW